MQNAICKDRCVDGFLYQNIDACYDLERSESHNAIVKSIVRVMTLSEAKSHNAIVKSIVRVMKLTALLLLVGLLHVSAATVSQTITLRGTNIPLSKVFAEIEKQTGFVVVSSYQLLEKGKPVTVNASNQPLPDFIRQVLADQPLTYTIEEQND